MEDDLNILKLEYLNNHWSDVIQIWNLNFGDQSKGSKYFKWRQTLTEDDLKTLKLEYLSNNWLDFTQIWNLSLDGQSKVSKWRQPLKKTTSKY